MDLQKSPKIGVIFAGIQEGALGGGKANLEMLDNIINKITEKITQLFPNVKFSFYRVAGMSDALEALKQTYDVTGYIIFVLNSLFSDYMPILRSGKPVILIGETYGGAGDLLLALAKGREEKLPVIGEIVRKVDDENLLRRYVNYLITIHKLKNSRLLLIVSPGAKRLAWSEYPLSVDLWAALRNIQGLFGIDIVLMNSNEFIEKYYSKVDENEARKVAEKWMKEAEEVIEEEIDEIMKSAKLYIAIKKAVKDFNVDAVAIDCIVLYWNKFLDAWPCLAFMELIKNNEAVPVCEADIYSAVLLLIMKYLGNVPGFINDPSPDNQTDEIVYYHCFAPITPYGYGDGKKVPYKITSAHLGVKRASIYVELPLNETITVAGLSPDQKILTIHTAKTIRNEYSQKACAVKLIGKTNTKAIVNNWIRRAGWHRVVFYGDWREDLKNIAALLGLKVVEEDRI